MIITSASVGDRIRLIAIDMKGAFGNEGALPLLTKHVVETPEQMRNGFLRFVAHVGEAEGFAFDAAVAAVNDEVMFGAQITHEFGDVDIARVSDAGQRF